MIQNKKMGADFGDHIYNWQMLSIEEIAAIVSYIPITAVDRSVADLIHVGDCSNGDTCKNGFEKDNIIENIQKTLDQHLDKDVFMDAQRPIFAKLLFIWGKLLVVVKLLQKSVIW